jgi:5-methyltetrahydropteroyltriglutamate--homocysteine methyltransferase
MRRESYSNRFATALDGIDLDNPGTTIGRSGKPLLVPRVVGKIKRRYAVQTRDTAFLRANTDRSIKITLPGPFTLAQQAQDDYYGDDQTMAMDYADAVNAEIRDLFAAGADIVQLDEPWMESRPDQARRYGIQVLNRAIEGVAGTIAVHMCFGYAATGRKKSSAYPFLSEFEQSSAQQLSIEAAQPDLDCAVLSPLSKIIILGVLDLGNMDVETPETVARRIRLAMDYVPVERIVVAPDCGMKYLPRKVAFAKLRSMVEGARIVRESIQ